MASEIAVSGLAELNKTLQTLAPKIEGNIMRGAVRAGIVALKNRAQQLVPVDQGDLKRTFRVSTRSKRGRVSATLSVGNKEVFYAHMVEFGTSPHFIRVNESARPKKLTRRGMRAVSVRTMNQMVKRGSLKIGQNYVGPSVSHPGARPKPFMRTALDTGSTEAASVAADYIRVRLAKELRKK